jgi:hypothetical protein
MLRTPAQPFTVDFNAANTQASLTNERLMEAVYLASPALPYRREVERYGMRTIAYSEQLFCYQSTTLLDYMATTEPAQEELWQWGIKAINELLTTQPPVPGRCPLARVGTV